MNFALLLAGLLILSAQDQPRTPAPQATIRTMDVTIGASLNPPGLQTEVGVQWLRSTTRSTNPLMSDAHVAVGLLCAASPSYMRVGPWLEVSPLSILDIRAGLEPVFYFGSFGSVVSFRSYDEDFAWDAVRARAETATTGSALRAYVKPTFKMKAGRLSGAFSAELDRWRSNAGGPLYYEPYWDTLVRASGQTLVYTSATVLVQAAATGRHRLSVGGLHAFMHVYGAPGNNVERIGPIVVYEATGNPLRLPSPRIAASVSRYLSDPNKKDGYYWLLGVRLRPGR